jgi:lysyl-tRNA synthetase class 2
MVNGTLLAAGDPIGPQSAWPEAIAAFLEHARSNSAVPAVVAATEAGARAWTKHAGLVALEFGDEAVLCASTFTLDGRAMRNTRQAVTRAQRAGCTVRCARLRDLSTAETDHLADLADLWRGAAIERGFSMALGRLDVARDPDALVVTAELDGTVQALLFLVPWGGSDRLSLDVMRRASQAVSGVNELMISELMARAGDLGVSEVSLNFAVFREAIERSQRIGAGPVARMWGAVLQGASRLTQVDTLYRFNAKFCPQWRSRYLLYPRAGGLARVTWAYLRAESFLPRPFSRATAGAAGVPGGGAVADLRDAPTVARRAPVRRPSRRRSTGSRRPDPAVSHAVSGKGAGR